MAILRVRPDNAAGRWVNLALAPLTQRMFGGEAGVAGGVTAGLGARGNNTATAIPINAVLGPGQVDARGISFDVPAGTPAGSYTIALVVEGNFPQVLVEVPVVVVRASTAATA